MRTKPVSAAQVRSYAAKAEEFAEAAVSDLAAGRSIAVTSLAIHAGINSADAVCGARLGKRAAGEDHDQVLELLRQAAQLGGLGGARLVTEPEAAAVHFAMGERMDEGDVIAVYDLGGGTFDAAVLRRPTGR